MYFFNYACASNYAFSGIFSSQKVLFIDLLKIKCRAKENSDFDENDIFDCLSSRRIFGFGNQFKIWKYGNGNLAYQVKYFWIILQLFTCIWSTPNYNNLHLTQSSNWMWQQLSCQCVCINRTVTEPGTVATVVRPIPTHWTQQNPYLHLII